MNTNIQKYYFIGIVFLAIFWLISFIVTKDVNPFAMAKGSNKNGENNYLNASLVQMIVFTMLTIFAYTVVFAGRALDPNSNLLFPKNENEWLNVPSNLLLLMGISVGTAVGSRAIASQQASFIKEIPNDLSSFYQDRKGRTDLIKIQMLVWTVIAVVVYLTILWRFMNLGCFVPSQEVCKGWGNTLPDIDSAFLVLLGVSQGGYLLNKLSEDSAKNDTINQMESVKSPDRAEIKELTSAVKTLLNQADVKHLTGKVSAPVPSQIKSILIDSTTNLTDNAPNQQLTAKAKDAQGNEISNLPEDSFNWVSDDETIAKVSKTGLVTHVGTGNCNVTVVINGVVSNKCEVKCS